MGAISDYLMYNSYKSYPTFEELKVYHFPQIVSKDNSGGKKKKSMNNDPTIDSLFRTKATIRDIILCNRFDQFATFTFADHRDDVDICKARMHYWLKSQQRLHGAFDYLIVPEYHKDGKSLHFHALLSGFTGRLDIAKYDDTGNKIKSRSGKQVFNIPGWRNGFASTTFIDQDNGSYEKVAGYVSKYITKDMPKFHGQKRYWVSHGLVRPLRDVNVDEYPFVSDPQSVDFTTDYYIHYKRQKS